MYIQVGKFILNTLVQARHKLQHVGGNATVPPSIVSKIIHKAVGLSRYFKHFE